MALILCDEAVTLLEMVVSLSDTLGHASRWHTGTRHMAFSLKFILAAQAALAGG